VRIKKLPVFFTFLIERGPPCVIASHGLNFRARTVKSISLWGIGLSQEGLPCFASISGESGKAKEDKEDTISRRIMDLGSAIEFVRSRRDLKNRIGLLGSSLGGYVSLLRAPQAQEEKIRAVSSGLTPST